MTFTDSDVADVMQHCFKLIMHSSAYFISWLVQINGIV